MTNEEVKERLKNKIKKLEDLQKVGCIDYFGVIDYRKSILKELERLEKLEKAIEIIKKHFFLENFSDFISINGRLDKTDYNINEINLLKEVFEND